MDLLLTKHTYALGIIGLFVLSKIAFRQCLLLHDQRLAITALASLTCGYAFHVQNVGYATSESVLLTAILSHISTLALAVVWLIDATTPNKTIGIALALSAVLAIALPHNPKS
jgi:drug/metabolite transporter (DMT)-like permease